MAIAAVMEIETEMVFNVLKIMGHRGSSALNVHSAQRTMAINGLRSDSVTNRWQAGKQVLATRNPLRLRNLLLQHNLLG